MLVYAVYSRTVVDQTKYTMRCAACPVVSRPSRCVSQLQLTRAQAHRQRAEGGKATGKPQAKERGHGGGGPGTDYYGGQLRAYSRRRSVFLLYYREIV